MKTINDFFVKQFRFWNILFPFYIREFFGLEPRDEDDEQAWRDLDLFDRYD